MLPLVISSSSLLLRLPRVQTYHQHLVLKDLQSTESLLNDSIQLPTVMKTCCYTFGSALRAQTRRETPTSRQMMEGVQADGSRARMRLSANTLYVLRCELRTKFSTCTKKKVKLQLSTFES
jgi:hypothetical protein